MFARKQQANSLLSLVLLIASGQVGALQLETGKWEITTQSLNPMTDQPLIEKSVECIEDSHFDPTTDMMDDETCKVTDKQESDDSVSWKMKCGGGGNMPVFHGEGRFVSHGKSAEGEMKMVMNMGGQTMEIKNQWAGKHISSKCN